MGNNARPCGKKGERTLTGGPGGGATWFWVKNYSAEHGLLERTGTLAELWTSVSFPSISFPRYGTPDWPGLARGGRTVCVFVGVLKGL